MLIRVFALWCAFLVAGSSAAADLTIYDDALRNGFANLSWPGPQPHPDQNFQANFHQHTGSHAIFYKAHSWNGLSVGRPGNGWTTSQYPELRFWIRGDAGGEQLNLHLQGPGGLIGSQPLAPFVNGGAIAANSYREVVIRFTQPPWSHNGVIERIDLQDASGIGGGNAQWVFIDDMRLVSSGSGGGGSSGEAIFANGFEVGSPSAGLSPTGRRFFHRLHASQAQRVMVGHHASTAGGVGWRHWQFPNNRSDFHDVSGRYPAVYGWELETPDNDPTHTFDTLTYAEMIAEALEVRGRGGINTFGHHMRRLDNPAQGSWQVQPAGLCARLVPGPNGDLNGAYRTKLDLWISRLLQLRSGGRAVPFLFRPFHEADANWFWWGTAGCTDDQFKTMFRYTIEYMRNAGLRNMLVVYAPGVFTNQAQYLARYPGDDVVDVIAMDGYLNGTADPNHGSPLATLTQQLGIVHALAQARGKIAAWAETGQLNITSVDAFSQLRQAVQNSGAKIAYMMFWANYEASQYYVPYNALMSPAVKTNFNNFLTAPMVTEGQYPAMYP